jgi:hypothetical protein
VANKPVEKVLFVKVLFHDLLHFHFLQFAFKNFGVFVVQVLENEPDFVAAQLALCLAKHGEL